MPPEWQQMIKSFSEELERHGLSTQRRIGLRTVQVKRIVGSVGRSNNLRSDFRPYRYQENTRYNNVLRLMKNGTVLPSVSLYELLNEYYVLDGHHRVGVAREIGRTFIDADVVQFLPNADSVPRRLSAERARFELHTGLRDIELMTYGGYSILSNRIASHRLMMSQASGADVGSRAAARAWYESVYTPAVVAIMTRGLVRSFPDQTLAEIYLRVEDEKYASKGLDGHGKDLQEAVDQLIARYPAHGLGRELERVLIGLQREVLGTGRVLGEVVRQELVRRIELAAQMDPDVATVIQSDADQMSIGGSGLI